MKHLILTSIGLLTVSSLSSQLVKNGIPSTNTLMSAENAPNHIYSSDPVKGENENDDNHSRVVFWSEDFNGGLTTANGTWTSDGPNGAIWEHTTAIDPGCFNGGAQANFTTAANGFLLYNADDYNCVNASTNPPTYNTVATTGSIISPIIDCSTEPSVMVTFQHNFRYCCNANLELHLSVTNDGGTTWTDFNVKGNTAVNDYPGGTTQTAVVTSINVTSVAANQPNVQIKFTWNPTGNTSSHYFWAIDDIELEDAPDNDLAITNEHWGSNGAWSLMPYYLIPQGQQTDIWYSAIVENAGVLDQTNSTLTLDINAGAFTSTSTPTTIVAGNSDSLFVNMPFVPAANGTYNFDVTVAADAVDDNPNDNSYSGSFDVNDYIYARDMGVPVGGMFNSGNGYEGGNVFDIFNNQTVYGIEFRPDENSQTGSQILVSGILYEIDMTTGNFIFLESTDDYFLDPTEFGTLVTLPFFNSVNLVQGSVYLAVIKTYGNGGASNDLVISTSGDSDPQTSFIYLDDQANWFYSTNTPMVRLNFDPNLCVTQNTTDVISACETYTWTDGNTYTSSNNSASQTLTDQNGCDSIVTLDLTIYNSYSETDVVSACNSYTWVDGNVYNTSNNTATFMLTSVNGCDSLVNLNLTITQDIISVDPSDQSEVIGDNAVMGVVAPDQSATFQWQIDDGSGFQDLQNTGQYNGVNSDTLFISNLTMANDGNNFRCIAGSPSCNNDTSTVANLEVIDNSSLEENNLDFQIYPNPTKDFITIKCHENLLNSSFTIYNAQGLEVLNGTIDQAATQVNLGYLSSGVYIVKVKRTSNYKKIILE